jgi:hypothetical protein
MAVNFPKKVHVPELIDQIVFQGEDQKPNIFDSYTGVYYFYL